MKSIKDLREQYDLITEKEEHDMNRLTQLVRAGLFDAKKLSSLKRAMEKPADKMTAQEKRMLINLLDALMSEVLSDKQVYRKIKQDVMMKESKNEKKGMVAKDVTNIPAVILLKRKALRAFPDGQKVGLYYAQAIDKYVSIPFSEIGVSDVNEEINLEEGLWDKIKDFASNAVSSSANTSSSKSQSKYYDPMSSKLATTVVGTGSKSGEDSGVSPALLSWERQRYRQSLQTEELNEAQQKKEPWDKEGTEGARVPRGGGFNPSQIPYGQINPFRQRGSETSYGGRRGTISGRRKGTTLKNPLSGSSPVKKAISVRKQALTDIKQKRNELEAQRFWEKQAKSKSAKPAEKPETKPGRPSGPPDRRIDRPFEDPRTRPSRPDPRRRENQPEKKPEKPPEKKPDTKQTQSQGKQTRTRTDRGSKVKKLAAAAAGLGILGSMLRGGSDGAKGDEKKYTTPRSSTFKPTLADPKYSETDSAVKSLERRLFRQSMTENVELDGNIFELNTDTASKVKTLYESLNKKNKKKMLEMMNESTESLEKVISFAVRQ